MLDSDDAYYFHSIKVGKLCPMNINNHFVLVVIKVEYL